MNYQVDIIVGVPIINTGLKTWESSDEYILIILYSSEDIPNPRNKVLTFFEVIRDMPETSQITGAIFN